MALRISPLVFAISFVVACPPTTEQSAQPPVAPGPAARPASAVDSPHVAPVAPSGLGPERRAQPASAEDLERAAAQAEACGQIVVVAFKGALQAAETITRDKRHAIARAGELLAQLDKGADFAELARKESDAPTSAARGGTMGTFAKQDWPAIHEAIKAPLFELEIGAIAKAPIEAEYGITIVRRCPIEKARSRHILVRYKGAKKADETTVRDKAAAKAFAQACLARLAGG
jgi:hypothetical protein